MSSDKPPDVPADMVRAIAVKASTSCCAMLSEDSGCSEALAEADALVFAVPHTAEAVCTLAALLCVDVELVEVV